MERLKTRDEKAFNELVHQMQRRVFGHVFRMLGNSAEAEDMTQEVFVRVFKAISQFRSESRLSTWVMHIATNICKNQNTYLSRRHSDKQDDIDSMSDNSNLNSAQGTTVGNIEQPDELMAGLQVERIVQQAIANLETEYRESIILRDVEDMSYEEIAEITGAPVGTVKSRIHRARERVRETIERKLRERRS